MHAALLLLFINNFLTPLLISPLPASDLQALDSSCKFQSLKQT